jgi:hypothetical protein
MSVKRSDRRRVFSRVVGCGALGAVDSRRRHRRRARYIARWSGSTCVGTRQPTVGPRPNRHTATGKAAINADPNHARSVSRRPGLRLTARRAARYPDALAANCAPRLT